MPRVTYSRKPWAKSVQQAYADKHDVVLPSGKVMPWGELILIGKGRVGNASQQPPGSGTDFQLVKANYEAIKISALIAKEYVA